MSVKAREAADTIFEDFGMTQRRIKPSLLCFAGKRSQRKKVQEFNAKRAKICLTPALCVTVICRQTVRKMQEIKELTIYD